MPIVHKLWLSPTTTNVRNLQPTIYTCGSVMAGKIVSCIGGGWRHSGQDPDRIGAGPVVSASRPGHCTASLFKFRHAEQRYMIAALTAVATVVMERPEPPLVSLPRPPPPWQHLSADSEDTPVTWPSGKSESGGNFKLFSSEYYLTTSHKMLCPTWASFLLGFGAVAILMRVIFFQFSNL